MKGVVNVFLSVLIRTLAGMPYVYWDYVNKGLIICHGRISTFVMLKGRCGTKPPKVTLVPGGHAKKKQNEQTLRDQHPGRGHIIGSFVSGQGVFIKRDGKLYLIHLPEVIEVKTYDLTPWQLNLKSTYLDEMKIDIADLVPLTLAVQHMKVETGIRPKSPPEEKGDPVKRRFEYTFIPKA